MKRNDNLSLLKQEDVIKNIDLKYSLFIKASAGTGKTFIITRLFLKYVLEQNIDFKKILLVTFTKKATQEMLIKIRELIDSGLKDKKLDFLQKQDLEDNQIQKLKEILNHFEQIHISTIHSFCKNILKNYPFELNFPSHAKIIESEDAILKEIFLDFILEYPKKKKEINLDSFLREHSIQKLYEYTNRFILESKNREDYVLNFIKEEISFKNIISNQFKFNEETLQNLIHFFLYIYKEIDNYKKFKSLFTYNDLIVQLYKALAESSYFLSLLQNLFTIGIIDEFQDTDSYQWLIFKKIFLDKDGNHLVVVGDPKQSIYGFRGADIYVYQNAEKEFSNLTEKAKIYTLDTNYRSTKEFINKANYLMKTIFNNFYNKIQIPKEYQIDYETIKPADWEIIPRLEYNQYQPINFIKVEGESINDTRTKFSEQIAKIIFDLVRTKYKYSDIAILYRSNNELSNLKKILLRFDIPFIDFSNISVFNTLEALAIEYLLYFLAYPDETSARKRFLLYYFIDIPYTKIENLEDYYFYIQEKISEWIQILQNRNWLLLFYKVLEDTKFYYKYLSFSDYERKITNFEHIIEILVEIGTKKRLGAIELYNEFLNLKRSSQEDLNLKLESEDEKVQLLTIHKSKGLEFPIVFISGWYDTKSPSIGDSHNYKYFDFDNSLWNICFFYNNDKIDTLKKSIEREFYLEELRLFYVAITRAKEYVFCVYPFTKSKLSNFFSSIDLTEESLEKINFIKDSVGNQTKSFIQDNIKNTEQNLELEIYKRLKEFESIPYKNKVYALYSYSSLIKNINTKVQTEIEQLDYDEVLIENESHKTIYHSHFDKYFPSGANTGTFIHKIFEIINFQDFQNYIEGNIRKIYKTKLEIYKKIYSFDYGEAFDSFFYNFLNEILSIDVYNGICLKNVDPKKIKKELGFLIQNIQSKKDFIKIFDNSFITGSIDLFFEYDQQFFLLDYKTTTLDDYEPQTLKDYTENHYKIQYLLYSYALYFWLDNLKKIQLKDYFNKSLPGGIIYFYLRGYRSKSKGVDFRKFLTLKDLEKELLEIYNNYKRN